MQEEADKLITRPRMSYTVHYYRTNLRIISSEQNVKSLDYSGNDSFPIPDLLFAEALDIPLLTLDRSR